MGIGEDNLDLILNSKILAGDIYTVAKRFTVPLSGIVNIVIDPTVCTCENLVLLPFTFKAFGAGPINIDIYGGVDSDSDGTVWESINRNMLSTKTSSNIFRLNPTINDDGVKLPSELVIFSDGTAAVAVSGGEASENLNIVVDKQFKYMFRLTNLESTAANAHVEISWWEK